MTKQKCLSGKHWYNYKGPSPIPGNRALGTKRKQIQQCRVCGDKRQV